MTPYWLGIAYGTFAGIVLGYLFWRLPAHVQQYQAWWQRIQESRPTVLAEIERIEGAFRLERYVPNTPPKPFLRERIIASWQQFWEDTRPRTPEQIARWAYEDAVAGVS